MEIAEQHRGRAVASIPLRTIRDFHEQSHALGLYCPACECWSVANLPFLIQCGRGELSVTVARFRWRDCGEAGSAAGAEGWRGCLLYLAQHREIARKDGQ